MHSVGGIVELECRVEGRHEDARTCRSRTRCSSCISTSSGAQPEAEPAARRWIVRYLSEGTPSLRDVANVTATLARAASADRRS